MKHSNKSLWEFVAFIFFVGGVTCYLVFFYPEVFAYLGFIKKNDTQGRNYYLYDFGISLPNEYSIHGIDVSRHQGEIDWKAVSEMNIRGIKIDFVFIKATEGKDYKDRFFQYNWQRVKEQKLRRGAYHFYQPNTNSNHQAKLFINQVTLESGDLPPVLDIEQTGKYSIQNLREGLRNWLLIVEKEYGMKPIIYTNQNFYRDYLKGHFTQYTFWIARYGNEIPRYPSSDRWFFWQHSDQGLVNGIAGKVDFNVFNGNEDALRKLCKP